MFRGCLQRVYWLSQRSGVSFPRETKSNLQVVVSGVGTLGKQQDYRGGFCGRPGIVRRRKCVHKRGDWRFTVLNANKIPVGGCLKSKTADVIWKSGIVSQGLREEDSQE